jgi:EF-P lysine aminoacylase GenX
MESEYRDGAGRRVNLYLQTSPEYAMKRLLVGGMEKIFQITKGFRNGEVSKLHNPEFTILEWYRAYDSFNEIMADTEELISELALRLKGGCRKISYQGQEIDLKPPWNRMTVKGAMLEYAGIDLDLCKNVGDFRQEAELKGHKLGDEPDWDTIFFTIFLQEVEPKLGRGKPTFLIDYPAKFGALAKRKSDDPEVVERFEVYIAGLELANAFTELNDPVEQRSRLMSEREERIGLGKEAYPIDEDFLYALECAMPPAGGIALGVDRLVMLLADRPKIEDVILFPFSQMTGIVETM